MADIKVIEAGKPRNTDIDGLDFVPVVGQSEDGKFKAGQYERFRETDESFNPSPKWTDRSFDNLSEAKEHAGKYAEAATLAANAGEDFTQVSISLSEISAMRVRASTPDPEKLEQNVAFAESTIQQYRGKIIELGVPENEDIKALTQSLDQYQERLDKLNPEKAQEDRATAPADKLKAEQSPAPAEQVQEDRATAPAEKLKAEQSPAPAEQVQEDRATAPADKLKAEQSPAPLEWPEGLELHARLVLLDIAQDRFDTPASYSDRFIVTKGAAVQEFYRSYEDKRPAIVDRGDVLCTKQADRATAMDMIELAAHRGWQSLDIKGPPDFKREMWIEATAHGIKATGYRPTDKDIEEANRRGELVRDRSIERTDTPKDREAPLSDRVAGNAPPSDRIAGSETREAPARPQSAQTSAKTPEDRQTVETGIRGTVLEIGNRPYKDKEGAGNLPFIKLQLESGKEREIWGVGLPSAISKYAVNIGDKATFRSTGTEAVTVKERNEKTGLYEEKTAHRRAWEATSIEKVQSRDANSPASKEPELIERSPSSRSENGTKSMSDHPERNQAHTADRLEERIRNYKAGDTAVRGAASAAVRVDMELKAAGVPPAERAAAMEHITQILSRGVQRGQSYQVQKLANVTREQVTEAKRSSPQKDQQNHQKQNKEQERSQDQSQRNQGRSR